MLSPPADDMSAVVIARGFARSRVIHLARDRRVSPRVAILVFALLGCVLYAIWHRVVPPSAVPHEVDADTMCFIYRFGLGGLCR